MSFTKLMIVWLVMWNLWLTNYIYHLSDGMHKVDGAIVEMATATVHLKESIDEIVSFLYELVKASQYDQEV